MSRKALSRGFAVLTAAVGLCGASTRASLVTFDNFNTSLGHFTSSVSSGSGTDTNLAATSTSTRDTTNHLEGASDNHIVLNQTTAGTASRLRHLSGSGTPANNVSFNITSGTDGFIGYYLKTTQTGMTVSLNLDDSANNAAGDDGAIPKTVIADGQWHLYEWNLDTNQWGAVAGVGGGHSGGLLVNGTHTIDSVYFQNITSNAVIDFDYLVKSDSGSVAPISFSSAATKTDLGVSVGVTGSAGSYVETNIAAPAAGSSSGSIHLTDIGNEAGTLQILLDLSNTTASLLSDLSMEIQASLPGSTVTLAPSTPDWAAGFDGSWSLLVTAPNITSAGGNDWLNLELPGGMTINRAAVIPEPTTVGLIAGAAAIAASRRRRRA